MRRAARRDENELELVDAARKLGAIMVFAGPLDWWCGRGQWVPVEIKTPKGRYTEFQKAFIADCKARKLPVWTWRSVDDVVASLSKV